MVTINPVSNVPKIRPLQFNFGEDAVRLNKSFKNIQVGLNESQKNIKNINNLLEKRISSRKVSFAKLFESERIQKVITERRKREDELEATKIPPPSTLESITSAAGAAGGGFLGRLMKAIGFTLVGALVKYIPVLTGYAQEFIARIQEFGRITGSFISNIIGIFRSTGSLLNGLKDNLLRLDFFDSERKVRNSFEELQKDIEGLSKDFQDTVDLFTTDMTKEIDGVTVGSYSGEEIPPVGGYQDEESGGGSGSGSGSTGGSSGTFGPATSALLDAIAFAEGTASQPNSGYLTHFGFDQYAGKGYPSQHPDIVKRTSGYASAAFGRYQFMPGTWKSVGGGAMTPERQDAGAVRLIKKRLGMPNISDADLEKYLAEKGLSADISAKLSPEWASFPTLSGKSYYGQPVKSLSQIQSVYSQSLKTRQTQQQTQQSQAGKPVSIGTTKLMPHVGPGGFLQGSSGKGMEDYPRYGVHFHLSPPNTTKEGLEKSRNVAYLAIKAMIARGSSVYLPNVKKYVPKGASDSEIKTMVLSEQNAHSQPGRTQGGIDIQESNPNVGPTHRGLPGSKIAFPFAVGKVSSLSSGSGYGREAEVIGSGGVVLAHGASGSTESNISKSQATSAQISSTPAQQAQQKVSQQITPERRSQDVVANIPQPVQQGGQQVASTPSGGGAKQASIGDMLNNFIRQKLLLDTSYL